jgi:hypothetical protein
VEEAEQVFPSCAYIVGKVEGVVVVLSSLVFLAAVEVEDYYV